MSMIQIVFMTAVKKIGFKKTENYEEARLLSMLNTCHIRDKAKEQSLLMK